jgi:APA family basic amino acid/polyamine antiporter
MHMDMFVFITWIFYGFVAYAIFIFRKKLPLADRPYRIKGYPYLPIIFIVFTALYIVVTFYNDISGYRAGTSPIINSVFGLLLTFIGIPFYWYFKRQIASNSTKDSNT